MRNPPTQTEYPYDLGSFGRQITTNSPEAQTWFNRGLTWAYTFNHKESAACFEKAIARDESCAMAYWGLAYATGPNYNQPWHFFGAGLKLVVESTYHAARKAQSLATNASAIEQARIAAIQARFRSDQLAEMEQYAAQNQAYADAMGAAYEKFSDDLDVATLYADALISLTPWNLWDLATGKPNPGTRTLDAKRVLESNPLTKST
ncbi:hypothetical protein NUU61_003987 [Penicillium alfredii]|uniref:Tetratricopeptide repeat protein n=1 Tax=Penicillium alfredii TaxID=1506179 RepID=A0A9W9FKG3_9EURO|nr:uncharacterized protein NUU61_003987 [Penicillium alfredii]KAJ5101765.1 hypothetical protein NUU61_003987 [Penicillium alfredii]